MEPKEQRKVDDFILFAMAAATQALDDADWHPQEYEDQITSGVLIGSGIGGIEGIAETALLSAGSRTAPGVAVLHSRPDHQSRLRLCFDHAFAQGAQQRRRHRLLDRRACHRRRRPAGRARRCRRHGGRRSGIAGQSLVGRRALPPAARLSTGFNETPERASRPYDRDRDGFVMGEGAGAVVLEEYEHAKRRGARIYGELIGYGLSGDAFHITAPAEDGDGAFRCMKAAIRRAEISPGDIDYINAHGTSTPLGDEIELKAVERLVGNAAGKISMSSTKSSIGHLLGAAGTVEAIFCLLAMRDQVVPPTINLDNPSVDTALDLVPHKPRKRPSMSCCRTRSGSAAPTPRWYFAGCRTSAVMRHHRFAIFAPHSPAMHMSPTSCLLGDVGRKRASCGSLGKAHQLLAAIMLAAKMDKRR